MNRYDILASNSLVQLVIKVNKAIENGAEPVGGIGIEKNGFEFVYYYQAVVYKIKE